MYRVMAALALIALSGCVKDKDTEYLNGPVMEYETFAMEKDVECTVVPIDSKEIFELYGKFIRRSGNKS